MSSRDELIIQHYRLRVADLEHQVAQLRADLSIAKSTCESLEKQLQESLEVHKEHEMSAKERRDA